MQDVLGSWVLQTVNVKRILAVCSGFWISGFIGGATLAVKKTRWFMCLKKHLFSITEQLFIKGACEDYKCFSISRHGDKICKIFSCHAPTRESEVMLNLDLRRSQTNRHRPLSRDLMLKKHRDNHFNSDVKIYTVIRQQTGAITAGQGRHHVQSQLFF